MVFLRVIRPFTNFSLAFTNTCAREGITYGYFRFSVTAFYKVYITDVKYNILSCALFLRDIKGRYNSRRFPS